MVLASLVGCGRRGPDAAAGEGGGAVRFEVVTPLANSEADRAWSPIISAMSASTGLRIEPAYANEGAVAVAAMELKATDVAWLPDGAALATTRTAGTEVFAHAIPPTSADVDRTVLVAAAKSKITLARALACERRLTLGLGEPLSTPGSLAPETWLFAPRGVAPAKCYRRVRRATGLSNLAEVAAGRLDMAAVDAGVFAAARREGKAADLVEIWRSPPLPEKPLVWRRTLDPAVKEKLRQFFLTYGQRDPAQRARLAAVGIGGFVPADNDDLLPAREMEATHLWLEAVAGGDKVKIAKARQALNAIAAERQDLEARTRAPAAAQ